MSKFNNQRLPVEVFKVDAERMQKGWYTDVYFCNIAKILSTLSKEEYRYQGEPYTLKTGGWVGSGGVNNGDIVVEMQFFTRRQPKSLVAGMDETLAILKQCTGYFNEQGDFVNTFQDLEIEAVEDGTFVNYDGNPLHVEPVLKIRGMYRTFAHLETPILGVLAEATRVATNVYNVLCASNGKQILFFPARFAHYKMQALHGYSYSIAVQAYNEKFNVQSKLSVSTDDQGAWWGGKGGGTIAHSSICSFFGDTAETMMQFSRIMPPDVPRIALVDFNNDCVGETLKVMKKMFNKYWELLSQNKEQEASHYILHGVRTDTSGNMKDKSVPALGEPSLDFGVNPRLVCIMREAIDKAYIEWNLPFHAIEPAKQWCKNIKIVVTGGFNAKKIAKFESLGVPVDIYGVGSSLLENSSETNNDFTADIVRVKDGSRWVNLAKIGRGEAFNENLKVYKEDE